MALKKAPNINDMKHANYNKLYLLSLHIFHIYCILMAFLESCRYAFYHFLLLLR